MDDDYITIEPGDRFTVERDVDGYLAVKIQDAVWVSQPRWLLFHFPGFDQRSRIDELIDALTELRSAPEEDRG
jgi:hypothetical protein